MYDFIHIIQFLIHIFFCLWLFFTTVPLLMKIWTVLIICLHSSTAYHERNKSYIMQLFKIEKQNFFLFGSRKIWKSFPHIGKVFVKLGHNFGQNFTIFSKNQKQCQLPGVGLISKYRSLSKQRTKYLGSQIFTYLILPYRNQGRIRQIFRSFFGRIKNMIICFWNFLTFSESIWGHL